MQLCIADNAVSAHLSNNSGDIVGSCPASIGYVGDLSIGESSKPVFSIYPNPSKGDFVVSLNLADAEIKGGVIQIVNVKGQIIKRININEQRQLNFSLKESGVYFMRLLTNKQTLTKINGASLVIRLSAVINLLCKPFLQGLIAAAGFHLCNNWL